MDPSPGDATRLLAEHQNGRKEALKELASAWTHAKALLRREISRGGAV